jgi:hypothetical protein
VLIMVGALLVAFNFVVIAKASEWAEQAQRRSHDRDAGAMTAGVPVPEPRPEPKPAALKPTARARKEAT